MRATTDAFKSAPIERRQAFGNRLRAALEDRILVAAATGKAIEVVHSRSGRPGEVRIGDERIISDAAVEAVRRLARVGALRTLGEDCYELAGEV